MDSKFEEVELTEKEKFIEAAALGVAVLLLLGCFLKVMFF